MTLSKIIEEFDSQRKNQVSLQQKLRWISQLDMKISSQILVPRGATGISGYDESTPLSTVALAPEEYSEIYTLYLNYMLDLMNGETVRSNNFGALFNRLYGEMHDYLNRKAPMKNNAKIKAGDVNV